MPQLSIIIPSKSREDANLKRLLKSLTQQSFKDYEVLIETQGNSEEAKATAALRATGEIVAFFCTDNDLRDRDFLRTMVWYANDPQVTGAYTARYDYVQGDHPLSRYFALLGANDPLCWWLGKADRLSYLTGPRRTQLVTFDDDLPSLGDNGFFFRKASLQKVPITPATFGSCMCLCEDLKAQGEATYWRVAEQALWHRTGEGTWAYLTRRYHYVKTLYFAKQGIRRWRMVRTASDWARTLLFAIASLLLVPQLLVAVYGYRRVRDWSWFLAVPICFCLTLVYTYLCLSSIRNSLWWSVRSIGHGSWQSVSKVFELKKE